MFYRRIGLISKFNREIFRLAIPNILTNVSVPLISSVDTALMGHLSVMHLGAIGLASMIFNFLYWNFGFLRMGTTGLTAQATGAENQIEVFKILFRSILTALVLSVLLILFKKPLVQLAVWLLHVPEESIPLVQAYFNIRIFAAPATLGMYVLIGWFFGRQNAKIPMFLTIWINLLNIVCSYYLVKHAGLGIRGAAWGTSVAQYSGFILGVLLIWVQFGDQIRRGIPSIQPDIEEFKGFFRLNRDIFLRTLFLSTAFAFFNAQSAIQGPYILAANVIFLQYLNWMSYGIDGFAFATESVIGKYHGKDDKTSLDALLKAVFFWGTFVAILYGLAYNLFGSIIFDLFTKEYIPREFKQNVLNWAAITPIFGFAAYIWDGVFVGLTASKAMRNSMLFAFLIYIPVHFALLSFWPHQGMLMAINLFLLGRALIQYFLFRKKRWTLK